MPSDGGDRIRLVGAVLAEQHDEWAEGRRYLGLGVLARSRMTLVAGETSTEPVAGVTHREEARTAYRHARRRINFVHHAPGLTSIIGLYKTELIKKHRPWKGFDDLELATAEWVDWYNCETPRVPADGGLTLGYS